MSILNTRFEPLLLRHPANPILTAKDWPYSSFSRFVCSGDYSPNWGCAEFPSPMFGDLDEAALE